MKTTKRPSALSDRIKVKEKMNTLESYLMTCPNHVERYDFESNHDAKEFGEKLREIAMKEEGVNFPDQMVKFDIEISLLTVRIKIVVCELASR